MHLARFANGDGTNGFNLYAAFFCGSSRNFGATFGVCKLPDMALAVLGRDDLYIKTVGFRHHAIACQKVLFGLEGKTVDLTAQPRQRYRQIDG